MDPTQNHIKSEGTAELENNLMGIIRKEII